MTTNEREAATEAQVAPSELIFAMDIGTRSIIGIAGIREGEMLRVLDIETREHPKRAMIDGQIEDIEQVSRVAQEVKSRLERKLGFSLTGVYVAAAGRALKTRRAEFEIELSPGEPISEQKIIDLEMGAIGLARAELAGGDGENDELSCVGHSVVRYLLDDYPISKLVGHKGRRARVEAIATFLPNEVVESLYAAMSGVGLMVSSITLEPIAAMNAIIPKELRMLNLALVDIGAGTSDIAVSSDGSVTAYTMATEAGDEITDAIMQAYLVDFETAERIKNELSLSAGRIEYNDILGVAYSVTPSEVIEKVEPVVDSLCRVIAERILEVNGHPPAAVFLVGGGSQYPELCARLAEKLSIDESKVAVGGNNYMKRMVSSALDISSPEYATPMGIAITAMESRERGSFTVTLNGKQVRILKNGALTVMDILLMNGFRHSQIIGRAGKSVTYTLNGEKRTARGGFPTSAQLLVNGEPASISTAVSAGDAVTIVEAAPGADARLTVRDLTDGRESFCVFLDGESIRIGTEATINGMIAGADTEICELDTVELHTIETLSELCAETGLSEQGYRFYVGEEEEEGGYLLRPNDEIRFLSDRDAPEREGGEALTGTAGDESTGGEEKFDHDAPKINVTVNQNRYELPSKADNMPYLFVDMLNLVDIDPSKPQGNIVLQINGKNASYLEQINNNDTVDIYWDGQTG